MADRDQEMGSWEHTLNVVGKASTSDRHPEPWSSAKQTEGHQAGSGETGCLRGRAQSPGQRPNVALPSSFPSPMTDVMKPSESVQVGRSRGSCLGQRQGVSV